MEILFSDHADEQMHKRGISRDAVLDVVRNGQRVWIAFRGRSLHYNKRVVVVTTPNAIDEDGLLVVTVYKRKRHKKSVIEKVVKNDHEPVELISGNTQYVIMTIRGR